MGLYQEQVLHGPFVYIDLAKREQVCGWLGEVVSAWNYFFAEWWSAFIEWLSAFSCGLATNRMLVPRVTDCTRNISSQDSDLKTPQNSFGTVL